MKIAAFNVENLFDRAKAFNEEDNNKTQSVIRAVAELNCLFEADVYSNTDKQRMLELVDELELNRYNEGPLALIRKIRGRIIKRPQSGGIEVVAEGRDSWVGWAELKTAPVDEVAVMNTGRVIRDVDADILAVVEAENRVALKQFSEFVFDRVKDEVDEVVQPYSQIMLIDGNDDRGIDVGLMTKEGFDIGLMQSHIHDLKPDGYPIFSRDCPEYAVTTPSGELIWVIPNHFKSKFGGNDAASIAKRKAQATRVAEIYRRLRDENHDNIVILGDFNDTPESAPLQPLLAETDLRDVSEHALFDTGEFNGKEGTNERGIGTFGLGNDGDKIDYLLLSPTLFDRVTATGLFRKGAWPGSRPPRWTVYDEITEKVHVASDHHVIWAEID
ncbi:endonuclease/exonuclease/phosphatase family protein [Candidatus Hydrogenedentota bacterium]